MIGDEPELRLDGYLDRRVAAEFLTALAATSGPRLVIRINSPGGHVHEAVAVYEAIRRRAGHVTAVVDGMAASAASFVLQAADYRVISPHAQMMIHEAAGGAAGNAAEHRRYAANMERVSAVIANIYADRAGGHPRTWRALMLAETWYTPTEAVDAGLADAIDRSHTPDHTAAAAFDLSRFIYPGRVAAPAPRAPYLHTIAVASARRRRRNAHRTRKNGAPT